MLRPFGKAALTGIASVSLDLLSLSAASSLTPAILTIDAAGASPTMQTNSAGARRLAPLNISFSLRKPCEYLDNLESGPRMGLNRT